MRQLNPEEKVMTVKGIIKVKKDLVDLKETLTIQDARKRYLKAKQEFETIATPYNRKIENDETQKIIDTLKEQIKLKEYSLTEMEKHIKFGVQEKEPPKGV